jgi:hypothetical protein
LTEIVFFFHGCVALITCLRDCPSHTETGSKMRTQHGHKSSYLSGMSR